MQQVEQKGCLARNWKWLLPVGCFGLLAVGVAFVLVIVLVVFGAIKSTDVYREALQRGKSNPAVIRELGEPIEEGWYVSGSVKVSGASGEADISIPISGPKKSGTIHAVATKRAGRWDYSTLTVNVEGQSEAIDLLSP